MPHVAPAPEDHLKALTDRAALISSGNIKKIKETALSADFKSKIVEDVLGYTSPVGNSAYTVESEQKILKGSVDLTLGHLTDGKADIIAPFELKGAKTKDLDAIMPGRNKTQVQQAWEYATNNVGIKTGLNAAFVIDTKTKNKLCAIDPKSQEILLPLLKGGDLARWRVEA